MKLFFVILTLFVVSTNAKNATLYMVDEPIKDQYIVVMEPWYDMAYIKRLLLNDVLGASNETSVKHTYTKAIKGFAAKLTMSVVERLLMREEVKYITQDGVVRKSAVASWGLDRIDQRELPLNGRANFKGDGKGVNVYVIDTGIYPDSLYFDDRATAAFDVFPDTGNYGIDCDGHGTHCAGTVGSNLFGVAPQVNLFGVRVLDCQGSGEWSGVIAGCDFVAQNGTYPAVASMSLGGGVNQAVDDAVQGMIDAGITTVAAAGNSGRKACRESPARGRQVITVGGTDIYDKRAYFSNFGKCVDLFAPGVDIPSAWIGGPEETNVISGTSMACPHVTGAVAVALAKDPTLTPKKLRKRIVVNSSTKDVITDPGRGSPNRLLYLN